MDGGCGMEGFLEEVALDLRITKIFNKGKGRGRLLTKATRLQRLQTREKKANSESPSSLARQTGHIDWGGGRNLGEV